MKNWLLILLHLFTFNIVFAQVNTPGDHVTPFVLGETHHLESKVLGESRTINIYIPNGYKADDTTTYSVIYLLDGAVDEDFIHIAGIMQFNSFPWVNLLPNTILVGIANTDRHRDFTFYTSIVEDFKAYPTTGGSQRFIQFLAAELQTYIEDRFRTNGSKMLIGQSLGGLLATEILLKFPDMFNQYVIVSPSLWWDDGSLLKQTTFLLSESNVPTQVYVAVGKEGLGPGSRPHVMEDDVKLLAGKLQNLKNPLLKVHYEYLPEEDHATILHQAVFNAMRKLFPK